VSGGSGSDIPLFDVGASYAAIADGAQEALARLGPRGAFSLGEDMERFEAEFAAWCGAEHCVGLSDGTVALQLALEALGVGPGDEVVTTPNTFVATVEAIAAAGATPVLADVDPESRCLDPAALEAALGPVTAAVIPVHLYGRPAPMQAISEICTEAGAAVVEDACQAHGARLDDKRAGTFGAAGAFSFYPTKNLGALGDGGAIVTGSGTLAAAVRSLRHHGADGGDANTHLRRGGTHRLDNLQAAFLRLKLERLDEDNRGRRAAAAGYRERLADLPLTLPPEDPPGGEQVYHLFVVEVDDRDRVIAELRAAGIGAAIHYPTPIHLQPAWTQLGAPGDFPDSERLAQRIISLPLFPTITEDQIDRVAEALRDALAG
jgi:dTDP-4-amino-4,6-dideoxygalactose transaminase